MGIAAKNASFKRKFRHFLTQGLCFALILSTLSVLSPNQASALDLSATDCPTVQVTTTSTVTYSRNASFCVLEFKSGSNNFTVPAGVQSAAIIVVGGGGGGGARDWAGGGGAGGVLYGSSYPLTANATVALSVGTGGTGATSGGTSGANGGDSTFGALTAKGGGGGAGSGWSIGYTANGSDGGSGGGSGEEDTVNAQGGATNQGTFSNVTPYGNRGGHQLNRSGSQAGGGGGGAGGAGTDVSASSSASNRQPGAGGAGISLSAGKTFLLAAGGGGGSFGIGGAGGSISGSTLGGAGGNAGTNGGSAAANTGSGGGGAGSPSNGGSGGSGLVVIAFAYDITYDTNNATGGTVGSDTKHGFNSTTTLRTNSGNLVRTGYTFAGWNTQADGLGTSYAAGATYATNASLNLFARWTLNVCSSSTTSSGGYTYVAFKTTGTCSYTPPATATVIDLLVVAGGGGGGSRHAGGGGAGGLINSTSSLNGSAITITVGAGGGGGAAQSSGGANASNGESSAISGGGISTRTANGGGGGGYGDATGSSGGSGGGGGSSGFGPGGATPAGQGNSGSIGALSNPAYWVGGGGGGAGTAGTTSLSTKAGSGGAGLEISWIPTAVGSTLGVGTTGTTGSAFAGGGGGGSDRNTIAGGNAGTGGGGAGSTGTATPSAGTANTGGGGGGAGVSGNGSVTGGAGGSGLVVIRYVNAPTIALSTSTISGTFGTAVTSYTVNSTGGPATSYSISPALAVPGLSFSTSTGQISGTPTAGAASANYTVTATNTSGTSAATFSLTVAFTPCSPSSTTSGGFTFLTFLAGAACGWTVPTDVTSAEVLVVGGGGGGNRGVCGANYGAGGGGGAVLLGTRTLTPGNSIKIIVGAGGAAALINCNGTNPDSGTNGGPSTFDTDTVNGGVAPARTSTTGGASGNGNAGGTIGSSGTSCGTHVNNCGAGGGGGAQNAGSGLTGGGGVTTSISGTSTMYGGGGPGRNNTANTPTAISGDGKYAPGVVPTANTGGGGSDWTAGADGVVIVKYAMPAVSITTPSTGLTGTVGAVYSLTLAKSGGSGSGTFSIAAGTLPAGLTLDGATGVISGTPTAAGTFAITARITDTNTTVATTSSFSFVIGKSNQAAISAPVLSASSKAFPYSQTPLTVTSVTGGSSTGALSITSVANGNATGCAWDGTTLTASTSGTCTLTVTKAADSNYEAITTTATFTFTKATTTTVITCSNQTYTGSALTPCTAAVTGAGGLSTTTTVTYANNTNAGTATANATYAESTNHLGSTATQVSFTIAKATSSTIITCSDQTYTGSALTPCTAAVTGAGGLSTTATVVYTNNTNAGTATANATYATSTNHLASTATQVTFTIAKASTTTVITCSNQTYTGSALTPCTAAVTGAGGLSTTATVVYISNTNAGTATANATYATSTNHLASTATQVTFTIAKASTTTVITCSNQTYTGSALTPCTAAVTGAGGLSTTATVTYTDNTNTGTATANATYAESTNHLASSATQVTFAIGKASTTTVITCSNQTYTGSALTPCTAAVTGAGGLSTTTTVTYANNTNAGTATANATYAESTSHLGSTATQVTFTIAKATQTITFGSLGNRTLGSGTYVISATSSSGLTVSFTSADTAKCTTSAGTITLVAAGTCTINANQTGDTNYLAATQVQRTFTVAAALSITTPGGSSLFGTYNVALNTVTITATGGAGSKTYAATGSLPTGVTLSTGGLITGIPTTAGDFSLTVTATDANGATATTSSFTISIAKAVSTILLSVPTYTYTGSGQGPDSVTKTGSTGAVTYLYAGRGSTSYPSSSTKPINAGTYTVTATLAADANFALVSATSNFEILSASLVITPTISASSMTYGTSGASLPTISFTKSPDLTLTTNPTCSLYLASDTGFVTAQTLGATLGAGSFVVRCAGADLSNYTITYGTNPTFTVNKAAITLSVGNPTSVAFTGSAASVTNSFAVTTGALVGSNAISGLTYTYTSTGGYNSTTTPTAAGTYTITGSNAIFSNGVASNYTITYATGTLTITGAGQSITFTSTQPTNAKVAGPTYAVTATGGASGNAVSFTSLTTSVCTVATATVTFLTVGTCTVAANQGSSANYNAASQATQTFTVAKGDPTFSAWSNVSKTFGDAAFTITAPGVTGSLGGTFTFSSGTTTVISIAGTTLTVAGGGTSVITATFTPSDSTNYNNATTAMTVTVSPGIQTVTWAPTTALLTTTSPATPSTLATALGSAQISYAVTNAGTTGCTVDSATGALTFTTAGSCVVTATAAATADYLTATRAVTFAISLATRTLTIDTNSYTSTYTMVAAPPTLTATASVGTGTKTFSSSTTPVCTINASTGVVTFVSVGTCTIAASIAADSTYLSVTSSNVSFATTLAAALTPTFGTPTPTATGFTVTITNYSADYTWAGTATASGTVTVNSSGLVTVTGVAAGITSTATITSTRSNYTVGSAPVSGTSIPVYTITYAAGIGGSGTGPTTPTSVSFGATFTTPANTFVKNGFTFAGWNDGTATYQAAARYPSTGTISSAVTLTATWSGNICSPTSTTSGGYTRYTFTSTTTCFWDVPVGVSTVDVLAVAGGSGGGYSWDNTGAGGGAGGQVISISTTLSGTVTVTVGQGGAGGIVSSTRGSSGTNTSIAAITALAGTGGCSARSACSVTSQATALIGANGGAGGSGGAAGRGGGGSSTVALAPTSSTGGTGTASTYSGSSVVYGAGGAGGTAQAAGVNIPGVAGGANSGNGGGGASAKDSSGNVNGGAGGSGLIIVRIANGNTVAFNANGGTGTMTDQSIVSGVATALTSKTFTRNGYTFAGWNTNADGTSGTSYTDGQSVTITAGMTLYAKWVLNTYAVTFNANNGLGTMGTQSVTHGVVANLNANLFTRANYSFNRWADAADGSGITYENLSQATFTAGTILYAQWTPNTYVVTYNYNNATGGASTGSATFVTAGSAIVLPTPTKTGFTFAGWFSDAALSAPIGLAGASYSPVGTTLSLTAYAKWTAIPYNFTYDPNSADTGTVPTETAKQITQAVTIKANTGSLIRIGYTFSGWNTNSDGTGTNYLSGSQFTVGSSPVILYAKWSPNTYTVTYNVNGASGNAQRSSSNVTSDTYTTEGASIALPGAGTLLRSGYTFGGWNTSAAGNGTNRVAGDLYTTVSDVTFYAKWNPVTYSITYNGNTSDGGTTPTIGGYTTGQTSPYLVTSNTFTKTSNVFGGWNTAANGSGTSYSPGSSITTLVDLVLYAVWIPQYTLHYAINGGTVTAGSVPDDRLYNVGTSVGPVFSSLSRTGYRFDGWANGSSTILPGGNFTILSDSVLTAKWTAINYTISYNSDGGSEAPSAFTKQIGESFTVGSAVFKPGYNFAGWWNGTTIIGADAIVVVGSSNISYTAQWVAKVYRVTYDWNGGRGTAVDDALYTFGTTAITLPLIGDRIKDGYTFAGWSQSPTGSLLSATYIPTQSRTLYALWNIGNFTITYDAGRGTVANAIVSVLNGGSTILPLPTRTNFVFNGWHSANTGGTPLGINGDSFTPNASQTIFARWIQSSLYGIADSLTRIGSVLTVDNISNTFSGANTNSSVSVSVPANAFAAGTTINFDLVGNSSRAVGLLPGVNYLVSIAVSWLTGDETVPDTASDKPIRVTISNATIKAGASAYAVINNQSTLLGTATQDGSITVSIFSDPEIVIAATKPGVVTNVAATSNGNQRSVVSWNAPVSNGGSEITGYTATADNGAFCTTIATSCTISNLTNGSTYNFTVTATNGVGTSDASTSASATSASLYSVIFDAKSGSAVSNGSFLTALTVSEPTAPTRNGYAFAGWSTTDGGAIEVFPYSPGVTNNIIMFARWDALENAVTFDSKSGSSVASAIFMSGGTLAAPTAPTRTGFTFAGWSATDGGSAITFPHSPGVTTNITLYAKWAAVVAIVINTTTVIAPVIVTGDKEAKISTAGVFTPISASDPRPFGVQIDDNSKKFIAEIKVVEGKLVLTPEVGFSGKKIVTVTINENGTDRVVQVPLTVLPETVTKPVLTPVVGSKSTIRWSASPNATAYTVYLNGKKVCSTSVVNCSISRVLGPNAEITVVANGGDSTVSQKVEADFKQTTPVLVARIVSATITKGTLSDVDRKALEKVIELIKNQGFRTVMISNITTTLQTEALATERIAKIRSYILANTGNLKLNFTVVPASSRTYFNNISLK